MYAIRSYYAGVGPLQFSWSPAANLTDASAASPVFIAGESTTYTLTLTDALGNSISREVKVNVDAKPDVVTAPLVFVRITSYNVCYTKLLRIDQLLEVDFRLVFVTSYNDYAITAFKYSAFDYILKPVLPENVKSTIARILKTAGVKPKTEYRNNFV